MRRSCISQPERDALMQKAEKRKAQTSITNFFTGTPKRDNDPEVSLRRENDALRKELEQSKTRFEQYKQRMESAEQALKVIEHLRASQTEAAVQTERQNLIQHLDELVPVYRETLFRHESEMKSQYGEFNEGGAGLNGDPCPPRWSGGTMEAEILRHENETARLLAEFGSMKAKYDASRRKRGGESVASYTGDENSADAQFLRSLYRYDRSQLQTAKIDNEKAELERRRLQSTPFIRHMRDLAQDARIGTNPTDDECRDSTKSYYCVKNEGTGQEYFIYDLLGKGGETSVYLAKCLENSRFKTVACKIHTLSGHSGNQTAVLEARKNEIQSWNEVTQHRSEDYSYLLPMYDVFPIKEAKEMVIVMRACEGGDLDAKLKVGKLTDKQIGLVFVQLVKALDQLHSMKIIHYDIKPGNILFDHSRGHRIRVADFGLSHQLDDDRDDCTIMPGQERGTYYYLPPEALGSMDAETRGLRGAHVSVKVDVWSAGVVLFEMLFGRRPFKASTPGQWAYKMAVHSGSLLQDDTQILSSLRDTARMADEKRWDKLEARGGAPTSLFILLRLLLRRDPRDRPRASQLLAAPSAQDRERDVDLDAHETRWAAELEACRGLMREWQR
ncbi:Protein kinase domain [Carpediemonas membranifera]|uniref:Protein kinase domain n=1 Tax=Carpediemonas membranifera TaxID=201153 RepID=A0A8J6E1S9_9EUKA|nr:Protein kinase domain [Carpediemonas membranifera]|eukprot:KAG9391027.1 Protein kinase domain [Carpediemonas membranifera]